MNADLALDDGRLRGIHTDAGTFQFLGVPYAQSPEIGGRFSAPQPASPWTGTRDATRYGPTAPRPPIGSGLLPEPEISGDDYLNVNVFTATLDSHARRPVMVWIHGGGFVTGTNSSPWYCGDAFARDNLVFVSVNYRLGAQGFMLINDGPANRGILDVIAALEWVQHNIARFGGDPSNVTIAGQSAGAALCLSLLGAPRARGLFSRMISMSSPSTTLRSVEDARHVAQEMSTRFGITAVLADYNTLRHRDRFTVEATYLPDGFAALDKLSADQRVGRINGTELTWSPVLDGEILTADPDRALRTDPTQLDALLIGTTREEFNFILRLNRDASPRAALQAFDNLGLSRADALLYQRNAPDANLLEAVGQAMTDTQFRRPAIELAQVCAAAGLPTFMYEFAWPGVAPFGAAHCLDMPFAFDALHADGVAAVVGADPPQQLANEMHQAWVRFVGTGDPGWACFDDLSGVTKLFR